MGRTYVRIILVLGMLYGTAWAAYLLINREIQRQTLPTKFQLGWFYAEGGCGAFPGYRRAYAFSLADETVQAIEVQGISYFTDIDSEKNRSARPLYSGRWKPTPVPGHVLNDGASLSLQCGRAGSWFWPAGIEEALNSPGGFYRHSSAGTVFIVPQLRLVIGSPG